MLKHTPEPWYWEQGMIEEGDDYVEYADPDKPLIRPFNLCGAGGKTIISSGSGEYTTPSLEDARLLQAAPKGYACALAVLEWARTPGTHGQNPYTLPMVKAAEVCAAKVEGREVEDWAGRYAERRAE